MYKHQMPSCGWFRNR